ncbi:hypothetical protein NHP20013_05350 [Helicobacter bizzozeronii]|nr:hypothetical protein NHP20013_05350 [Helicobacter bizzozeronii]
METLAEGAIFVADAHHQEGSPHLPRLLDGLIANPPPQLFLMGDVFQILMGSVRSSYKPHALILEQLRILSQTSTIFYFEGNQAIKQTGEVGATLLVVGIGNKDRPLRQSLHKGSPPAHELQTLQAIVFV